MKKSIFFKKAVVLFLITHGIISNEIFAQDASIDLLPINIEDTTHNNNKDSFFKKILTPLKFKENRNNREKERVYKLMLDQMQFPNLEIIEWHSILKKINFKKYEQDLKTTINLYGYRLSESGLSKNPKVINEFFSDEHFVEYVKNKEVDIHLTIYNNRKDEITKLLNNQSAQTILINELQIYLASNYIQGINIFFDDVARSNAELYLNFIQNLNMKVRTNNKNIQINIIIPLIRNENSIEYAKVYNFMALNKFVDYYILANNDFFQFETRTNKLVYPDFKTIESTVNFYSNGKIPLEKLIIPNSYKWAFENKVGGIHIHNQHYDLVYADLVEVAETKLLEMNLKESNENTESKENNNRIIEKLKNSFIEIVSILGLIVIISILIYNKRNV